MAKENDENFSNFDPMSAFGLEMSEGENRNKSTSKPMNENNSAEEDMSSKRRHFVVVKSKDLDSSTRELRTLAIKNGFHWLRSEMSITRKYLSFHIYMEIYKKKQGQKLVPIYKFICLNFFHCKDFMPIQFMLKFLKEVLLSVSSTVCGG